MIGSRIRRGPAEAKSLTRRRLVRDLQSGVQLDLFFVSAVASVLLIRFYLRLTGYPQVGGATLHVAHVLWGGLLMLAALILLLGFIGRASRRWAALLGGIGFGTFIDEVGKFVTRDNDYFYRPAVAMIYVVFVLAYLAIRSIQRRTRLSSDEYVINALHGLEEAALRDLQREERERALHYLPRRSRRSAGTTAGRADPGARRSAVTRFGPAGARGGRAAAAIPRADPARLSVAFVAAGITALRRSRQRALRLFHRSILISVFVTQVFMFYRSQWDALVVLAFNLLVLVALGYMRSHEEQDAA